MNVSTWSVELGPNSLLSFIKVGSGGGASGRAMAFCPSEPGSNPWTNFAFFGRMLSIYSRWALGYILRKQVIESATYSSFFFPVSYHLKNMVNVSIVLYRRKENKIPQKEAEKGPYLKKSYIVHTQRKHAEK